MKVAVLHIINAYHGVVAQWCCWVPSVLKVAGSNPNLAATQEPWASPSLGVVVACMTCCGALSGVQRLLDNRGQRGSWMPSKIFCIPFAKFLTIFLVVHLNFSLFSHHLSNFTRIRSLDAPQ